MEVSSAIVTLVRDIPASIGIAAVPLVEAYNTVVKLAAGQMDKPEVRAEVHKNLRGFIARTSSFTKSSAAP